MRPKPKNYYEAICYKYISSKLSDEDMIFDAMCIALNNLSPRYYRDDSCLLKKAMRSHLEDMNLLAVEASEIAVKYVKKFPREHCKEKQEQETNVF